VGIVVTSNKVISPSAVTAAVILFVRYRLAFFTIAQLYWRLTDHFGSIKNHISDFIDRQKPSSGYHQSAMKNVSFAQRYYYTLVNCCTLDRMTVSHDRISFSAGRR